MNCIHRLKYLCNFAEYLIEEIFRISNGKKYIMDWLLINIIDCKFKHYWMNYLLSHKLNFMLYYVRKFIYCLLMNFVLLIYIYF